VETSALKWVFVGLVMLLGTGSSWAGSAAGEYWVDAWAAAPDSAGPPLKAQTIRQIVRLSIGSSHLRIRLSNLMGVAAVTIGAVHVGAHAVGSAIEPGSDREVTFGGKPSVTIAQGADVISDSVAFPVIALQEIAVSMYLPTSTGPSTVHTDGLQTAFISLAGDATAATLFPSGETTSSRFFLTDIEVAEAAAAPVFVALGDSVTDGDHSTIDHNARWPDALAARLQADPALASIAVINSGIAGNRLLNDGPVGPSALLRFDRDGLSKPGVRWILLLEGINDIGVADKPSDDVSAEQIIDGMKSLIARAHAKKIAIWGGTLIPFGGSEWPFHSVSGEAKRQKINAWIRNANAFDAVVDFDLATRDPAQPDRILPVIDSGDHIHPNDAGYKTMAASIDLGLLIRRK
jgi:lysophospholipase L1-like esterase